MKYQRGSWNFAGIGTANFFNAELGVKGKMIWLFIHGYQVSQTTQRVISFNGTM